jgi:hypothetical protein
VRHSTNVEPRDMPCGCARQVPSQARWSAHELPCVGGGISGFAGRQKLEEVAQSIFLVAAQQPGLGEHALDHAPGLPPVAPQAGLQEPVPGRARTMGRDHISYDRRKFIYGAHMHLKLAVETKI